MSRTDKDRPRWVILNDETIPKFYTHQHWLFGTEFHYYDGNYVDYCTVAQKYTWHDYYDFYYLPCKRETLYSHRIEWGKEPYHLRAKPYRAKRRDFVKRQVKIYNSNPDLHDDLDFMNDEEFTLTRREKSHNPYL